MTKPITLFVPEYYDEKVIAENRLILKKTKALLAEDNNASQFIASIENTKNYQCNIPEIGEYQPIASKRFSEDRKKNWELQTKVSNCKVFTYNWDDKEFHFRIYWIVISESYMLQLVGIFDPKFSAFYKQHFMLCGLDTEIDTTFNFSSENNLNHLFNIKPIEISIDELQERIDASKQKENKARFLEENLKISSPNFYSILIEELKEKEEVTIESFMCTDWNMYYNLYNPENFSDPDSNIEWENNSDVYTYYKKPFTNNSKVNVVCNEKVFSLDSFKNLVSNKNKVEQKLLSFFEHYTFGNGGAYANAIYYEYAKTEIERLHNTTYTNQEFLKQNLYLQDIIISKNTNELKLYFKCSWDTEHGIGIFLYENFEINIEE